MPSSIFANKHGPFSLLELEHISGAKIFAKNDLASSSMVHDLASLSEAKATDISMLHQKKYAKALETSLAGACIIAPENIKYAPESMFLLVHNNPYKAFALISQAFYPAEQLVPYIAASACISASAILGEGCRVEHGAYIGDNAVIGARCKIGVNSYIGDGVVLGDDCLIENNVSISNAVIGNKAQIYPGARIGQDGFGFASDADGHYKIPHRGRVLIGHDVAIGANTCIDRGSLKDTVIEDWVRIDNLVQIGHNVKIGRGSVIAGQAGLAGSTELGEFVSVGGQAGVCAHSIIGNNVNIMAQSGVMKDVAAGGSVGATPAMPVREYFRQITMLQQLVEHKFKSNKS